MQAVLPISLVILIISLLIGVDSKDILNFIIGDVFLIVGLAFFSIGSVASTVAIAESIGQFIVKKKRLFLFIFVAFMVGFMITVAEPALWVLADQFKTVVTEPVLILTVAVGVGLFVVIALLRILTQFKLSTLFIISYGILFIIAGIISLVNPGFIPVAFDSGGVTTGPMAVPFIMSLGLGISKARGDKSSDEDSFGLIGIASIGPILSVLFLGLFVEPSVPISDTSTTFVEYFLINLYQMAIAILPFVLFFAVFQVIAFKLNKKRVLKIIIAFLSTYVGLVLFLTGANAGLVNIGTYIGGYFGDMSWNWVLIPLGMIFGFMVVAAEPSVIALNRQVEDVSAGAISRKLMMLSLSIGVSGAIGLACLRVITGISIWWILLPGYALTILLTFFSPKIFSSIAFDSGGAVSGAMTSAFLMPFALGAASVIGTNILEDAFGLVAFVAMAPLITIQLLGLIYKSKLK
ncbi:MAG: DUF1538 domain-containing protein [Bacteroidales bacterium]